MNELLIEDLNNLVLKFSKKYEDKLALFFIYLPIAMSLTRKAGIPFDYYDKYLHILVINDNEFPLSFDLWVESSNQNEDYDPLKVTGNLGVCENEFNSFFNNRFTNIPILEGNKYFVFNQLDPLDIERWLFEIVLHYCYNIDIIWQNSNIYQIGECAYTFKNNPIEW